MNVKVFASYRLHPLDNKHGTNRNGQLSLTLAKTKYRLIIIPLDQLGGD